MAEETLRFQAEVGRLLDIVAHALYSEKEVFLRELISNAADACDRLRYAALAEPSLLAGDPDLAIRLSVDREAGTLTVADNGIGMDRDELAENLGTIARSGTAAFLQQLSGDAAKDVSLIGQFGVGFYAAFMVAGQVEVLSRKAGSADAWRWVSDGRGEFAIGPCPEDRAPARGTSIALQLRDESREFLEPYRLRQIVRRYSDHIGVPIHLAGQQDGQGPESGPEGGPDDAPLNSASALWTRPRSEITPEQYAEFYRHVGHTADEPWLTLHYRAEGTLEYTALLFVPSQTPFDLFHPERRHRVRLYVKRVFITEECAELMPGYLRFLKGVVDSSDLPLNISREMLQNDRVVARIRTGLAKRLLSELQKKAEQDPDGYLRFWEQFGAVLKEGIYEDREQRDALLKLLRVHTTAGETPIALSDYVARMRPGQGAIYYMTGDNLAQLRRSPQLEGFRARGVEVLLLTDPVDEFWLPAVGAVESHPLRSVTQGRVELDDIAAPEDRPPEPEAAPAAGLGALIAQMKLSLAGAVKDVRESGRLTDSAVCLVAEEGDTDLHLQRLLHAHRQLDVLSPRVLEINPRHPLIGHLARLAESGSGEAIGDAAHLLLDQARIQEGEAIPDPAAFAGRLTAVLTKALTPGHSAPTAGPVDPGA